MFSPLFLALLFQTSFLVVDGGAEPAQDQQGAEWMDPVRCLGLQGPPAEHRVQAFPVTRPTWAQLQPGPWAPRTPF